MPYFFFWYCWCLRWYFRFSDADDYYFRFSPLRYSLADADAVIFLHAYGRWLFTFDWYAWCFIFVCRYASAMLDDVYALIFTDALHFWYMLLLIDALYFARHGLRFFRHYYFAIIFHYAFFSISLRYYFFHADIRCHFHYADYFRLIFSRCHYRHYLMPLRWLLFIFFAAIHVDILSLSLLFFDTSHFFDSHAVASFIISPSSSLLVIHWHRSFSSPRHWNNIFNIRLLRLLTSYFTHYCLHAAIRRERYAIFAAY